MSEKEFFEKVPSNTKYVENPNKVQLYQYSDDEYFCNFPKIDERDILKEYCVKEIEFILKKVNHPLKK